MPSHAFLIIVISREKRSSCVALYAHAHIILLHLLPYAGNFLGGENVETTSLLSRWRKWCGGVVRGLEEGWKCRKTSSRGFACRRPYFFFNRPNKSGCRLEKTYIYIYTIVYSRGGSCSVRPMYTCTLCTYYIVVTRNAINTRRP